MDKELKLLIPLLNDCTTKDIDGYRFYCGTVGNTDIIAMKCGIGKVNAALGTMVMIENFEPELIINTGVAGGTGGNAGVLDIVVGTRVA